jgi:hypothetical protein
MEYSSLEVKEEEDCDESCIRVVREVIETSRWDQRCEDKYIYRTRNGAGERSFSSILVLRKHL